MNLTAAQLEAYVADPVLLIREQFILPNDQPFGEGMGGFQGAFFRAVFAVNAANGRPVHRLVYDERRRGESKTEDSAAAGLADLLVGPGQHRSYAVAGDEDQAGLILDSIRGFKDRSPMLADVRIQKNVVKNEATGSELRVLSSDAPTAYGVRPRRVFFDELSLQADERLWTAMWSAIGKNPLSQMVAVSMAGWDFSSLGWRIRELAAKNDAYYFATREGSELAPWLTQADMDEQRATLHPADFARFWECRWMEPKGSWITREMYDATETRQEAIAAAPDWRCVGFVDIGLVHDPTAIAVCHREGELVVLDTLRTLQGSRTAPVELEAVENLVAELTERFSVRHWIFEAPQAVASVQRLQTRLAKAHVEARYPTAETQARLFGGLYQLFSTHRLAIFPHEQLRREALNLVTKTVAGRLKVVESTSIHQDHVIALGGAADMLTSGDKAERTLALTRDLAAPATPPAVVETPAPAPEPVTTGVHCGAFTCGSWNASPAIVQGRKTALCSLHRREFDALGWLSPDGRSTSIEELFNMTARFRP